MCARPAFPVKKPFRQMEGIASGNLSRLYERSLMKTGVQTQLSPGIRNAVENKRINEMPYFSQQASSSAAEAYLNS